jgi:hypothetical protein
MPRSGKTGFKPRQEQTFSLLANLGPDLGFTQPAIQWVTGKMPSGVKFPEREGNQTPSSRDEVKNGLT